MNEKVQAFLDKCEDQHELEEMNYHYLVMSHAGLLTDEYDFFQVSQKEYKQYSSSAIATKEENGKYYVKKRVPIDIPDEEFTAVESAIPKDTLADIRLKSKGVEANKEAESSGAATFFTIVACILFVGGFILALVSSISREWISGYYRGHYETKFDFMIFITTFLTYFLYGCFSLCAAELFKKLQTIVNLLRRKQ